MKYRKKPIIVEANEWKAGRKTPGVCLEPHDGFDPGHVHMSTGPISVPDGYMVVLGVNLEYYPVPPAVFAELYEPVTDEPAKGA